MHPSMNDIGSLVKTVKGIKVTNASAGTINGAAIDRQNYGSCELHHAAGDATGTPTTRTVDTKLQDSDDGSTGWNDYNPSGSGSGAAAQLTANDTEARKAIDLTGAKRYIRAVTVVAFTGGTSPAVPVAAAVVLGGATTLPQA